MSNIREEIEERCNESYNKHYGDPFLASRIAACLEPMLHTNLICDYKVDIDKGDVFVYYKENRITEIEFIKLTSLKKIRKEKLDKLLK